MEGIITLSIGKELASAIVNGLQGIPPWVIVVIISALPILELRGGIPIAIFTLNMSWPEAIFFSILGNMLPVPFILWFLGPVSKFLSRWKIFDKFFQWLFARARRKSKAVERYEALGLILFVGIPLPVTGAYTGSIAAYLFGISFKRAMLFIFIGVLCASVIVSLASLGILGAAGIFTSV